MDQLETSNNTINNLDSYNVVNNAFFHNSRELSLAFYNDKCVFSQYCLHLLDTEFIHILVSEEEQKLVIIPSEEFEPESIKWSSDKNQYRPRHMKCPIFFGLIMDMTKWDPSCKYKLIGTIMETSNEKVLVFDLSNPQIYMQLSSEFQHHSYTRHPYLTQEWKNRFGITFEDKKNIVLIKQHAEYTVIELPERS